MFFFLSGYGLTASHQKGNRIKNFPRRTILPFYIIILGLTGLYSIFQLLMGRGIQFTEVVKSLTFGGTIIVFGWYLQVQLIYYLFFYVVYRYCRLERRIAVMICLHMCYMLMCIFAGLPSLFYERTFMFVFGMVWCIKRKEIDAWIDKGAHAIILWLLSLALFVILYVCSMLIHKEFVKIAARGVSYFFFVTVVIIFFRRVEICNWITKFFSKISLELYVMQGMAIQFFHSECVYLKNPIDYIAVSTDASILLAYLIHPLIVCIYRLCRTGLHVSECQ